MTFLFTADIWHDSIWAAIGIFKRKKIKCQSTLEFVWQKGSTVFFLCFIEHDRRRLLFMSTSIVFQKMKNLMKENPFCLCCSVQIKSLLIRLTPCTPAFKKHSTHFSSGFFLAFQIIHFFSLRVGKWSSFTKKGGPSFITGAGCCKKQFSTLQHLFIQQTSRACKDPF